MNTKFKLSALVLSMALVLPLMGNADYYYDKDQNPDIVYTLSNNATANEVLAFKVDSKGNMVQIGHFATGGKGTGTGLGNQGALALSQDEQYLFAVNAGTNDVSVFQVKGKGGLKLVDRAADEGKTPVSVTVNHGRVFVVNAGDDSIYGYQFNARYGKLSPIPLSHKPLSGVGTGAAQISFDNDGDALVVTEKATNKITTFTLEGYNEIKGPYSIDSSGQTPFGFSFGKRGQFFVSEAEGGAAGGATVSSYELKEDGSVKPISGAVAVGRTAACWLVTTPNGRIAYTADTPASSISSFSINRDGEMTLINPVAATEDRPTDLGISKDGKVLYTLSGGSHSIGVYNIGKKAALTKASSFSNLPAGVTGLVVY